jgi:hypothetical protein
MEDDKVETEHEEEKKEPEKVPEPTSSHDDLRATVNTLSEKVASLESTVTSLLPQNRDETPVKKPWTHRSFG